MRLGLCQIDSQWENRSHTRDRIARLLDDWGGRADCLIFPEMGLSGFSMKTETTCLDAGDHDFFRRIAIEKKVLILYGGVENRYNCIFSVDAHGITKTEYRKRHLFSFGGERDKYLAGCDCAMVEICGMKFSLAICYDLRFSYHFWNEARSNDGYIVIASWPENRREHWKTLLRARAIENLAYVVGVNRVGKDPSLSYSGDSAVYGPFGDLRIECGPSEGIYCCDLDPADIYTIRSKYQFLEDRLQ